MDITIYPTVLRGNITAIPSKSQAHRLLICSAFANKETELVCPETNLDIEATASCLRALGAEITRKNGSYFICPIRSVPKSTVLPCGESGSTLRFLLPIVGALGVDGLFELEGRLSDRPLSPLWELMERQGCQLSRPTKSTVRCEGNLSCGTYSIDGGISSQFITGLLFALSLVEGQSQIQIKGKLESKPYVDMTLQAMSLFDVHLQSLTCNEKQRYLSPGTITVDGDWSNGAFFLAATAIGNAVVVDGLNPHSKQGDKEISNILANINNTSTVDASNIPDLIPILSVVAAQNKGCTFTNIQRLRLKESDRVAAVIAMLASLNVKAIADDSTLTVYPGVFAGGVVNSFSDHRIAMAAAIAATKATDPVTILNAHCVAKSYPRFWEEYVKLGGHYEQYIR